MSSYGNYRYQRIIEPVVRARRNFFASQILLLLATILFCNKCQVGMDLSVE